jgi:peptidoglycan hydrolase-like protein with peptidoglycan-binding domain
MTFDEGGSRSWRVRIVSAARRHPIDTAGLALMLALALAALVNALYLQTGKHPAPMRSIAAVQAGDATGSLVAVPRPRPAETTGAAKPAVAPVRPHGQVITDIQRELSSRGFYDGPVDGVYGPRMDAAIRDFEQTAGLRSGAQPDEDLLILIALSSAKADKKKQGAVRGPQQPAAQRAAAPSRRVLAVQRALAEFGYGQIKTTGVFDEATKAAVEKFERERKLPVSGQVSDRLMRELAAVTGRPLVE